MAAVNNPPLYYKESTLRNNPAYKTPSNPSGAPQTQNYRKFISLAIGIMIAVGIPIVKPQPAYAVGPAFTCQPGFYQVISGQLNLVNPATHNYKAVGPVQSFYNGMGYNLQDNYMYAFGVNGAINTHLIQIASDGTIVDKGVPSGIPAAGYIAADFDSSGNLVIRSSATQWYKLNVATNTGTSLTVTGATGAGNDIVFIGNKFYALNNNVLSIVDYSTLVTTNLTVSGVPAGAGTFGAGWTDNAGDLYFNQNSNGDIYQITGYATATPTGTLVEPGVANSNTDAASCPNAPSTFNSPTVAADAYSTTANVTLNVPAEGILTNDTGTYLTVNSNTNPTHGTLTQNSDGSFTYVPTTNYVGADSFTYTAKDYFDRTTGSATVNLTVNLPAAPVANNDSYNINSNNVLTKPAGSGVMANDTGTTISIQSHTNPSNGTLVLNNSDGSFTYTPNNNYYGSDSFTYVLQDTYGRTSNATVSFNVVPPAAPVANNDAYSVAANGTLTTTAATGVKANDTGTGITIISNTNPTHGTLTLNADGSFTYTPNNNYAGADSFTYTIQDQFGRNSTATVNLTVNAPAAPVANNDTYSTNYQTAFNIGSPGVQANDSGAGAPLSTVVVTAPTNGSLILNADGSFTYAPNSGFAGSDSFTYKDVDTFGQASNTATVNMTVNLPNPPVANDDSASVVGGNTLNVTAPGVQANDSGVGTPLTTVLVTGTANGSLTLNADGSYTYTPNIGFTGNDSFIYQDIDTFGQASNTATVNINVTAPAAPVANDDNYSVSFNTVLNVSAPGVLGNDTGTGTLTSNLTSLPSNGVVSFNADGSFTYTPNNNFAGTDTFTYNTTDSYGQVSGDATVTVNVDLPAAPVAADDSYSTGYLTPLNVTAPGVLGNDSGVNDTATVIGNPANGTLTLNSDGSFTYTPNANFVGTDSFTYQATDQFGQNSNTATVNVAVDLPAVPVANDDTYSTPYQTTLNVTAPGVLGNDSGVNNTAAVVTGPTHGSLTLNSDGSFTYVPTAGYAGADSFTYKATDEFGQASNPATVNLTVDLPAAPVANNDTYSTPTNQALSVVAPGVLTNDTGTQVTVQSNTNPTHGTVALNSDGSFTYTPTAGANYSGPDSFTYTAVDKFGRTSTATVNVNLTPVGVTDTLTATAGSTLTLAAPGILGNDIGSNLSVSGNTNPTHGTLTLNNDGSLTYAPTPGYSGSDSFAYKAKDSSGQFTTSTTVNITVNPKANDDSYTTAYNTALTVAAPAGVLSNDNGTLLNVTSHTNPTHGTLTLNADGSFTYMPNNNYIGADSFTYTLTDSSNHSSTANVVVNTSAAPLVTVSGTVVHDINRNGTPDSGEGMANVKVNLFQDVSGTLVQSATATTDANGNYTFSSLAPGNYVVKVDTTTTIAGTSETQDPDATLDNQTSVTVNGVPLTLKPFIYAGAQVSVTGTATTTAAGGNGTLTFVLVNNGPSDTAGVTTFTFTPPSGVVLSASNLPNACTLNPNGSVTCSAAQMAPGAQLTFVINFGVDAASTGGNLTGSITVNNQPGDSAVSGLVSVPMVVTLPPTGSVPQPITGAIHSVMNLYTLMGVLMILAGLAIVRRKRRQII